MTQMGNYIDLTLGFVTETCCAKGCNLTFAFTRDYYDKVRNSGEWWHCPAGHSQHYTGRSDAQKLRDAEARQVALEDQLFAAVIDAERVRGHLIRDRVRFANGVCPCCNRSFENVRRHMATKHPDYDPARLATSETPEVRCGCGRTFRTVGGLHIHQTRSRGRDWWKPSKQSWQAHLTVTS